MCSKESPAGLCECLIHCLLLQPASNRFISSISASVGALRRMRGRDNGLQMDRSMHDVDLTSQGQVSARQGSEPKAKTDD